MPLLISHRGNINGPNKSRENHPRYILEALDAGYHVEVDVWYKEDQWYLGHDEPKYPVELGFLTYRPFFCHVKNLEALTEIKKYSRYIRSYFWHENDRYTLTSDGYIWTYPRVLEVNNQCIIGCPEIYPDNFDFTKVAGIWSDNISQYKHLK